jgi:hypothetical protein
MYTLERCVGMTTVASHVRQTRQTKDKRSSQHTHTMRKRISSIQIQYFDGLCVCAGVVSVRALAILYAAPIHPCDCQMILRGYFIHTHTHTHKKFFFTLGRVRSLYIDARRYSSRGKKFANDLFRGRFNFCRMKYIFYFFFFSFCHVLGHFRLYSRNDRKCV